MSIQERLRQLGTWLIPILILLGFPAAFLLGRQVTGDLRGALAVTAFYAVVVIVAAAVRGALAEGLLKMYRADYLRAVAERAGRLALAGGEGRSVALADLYVEAYLQPTPVYHAAIDPIPVPSSLRSGEQTIWDYVNSPQMENLVVLGETGSGKSMLLNHIAWTLADDDRREAAGLADRLPVMVYLPDYAGSIRSNPGITLAEAFQSVAANGAVPSGWLGTYMKRGKCLLLVDGLDAVADPQIRRAVGVWIKGQMRRYSKCRFILASRPDSYRRHPFSRVSTLVLRPFGPEQIEQLARQWFLAEARVHTAKDDPGVQLAASNGANNLVEAIHNSNGLATLAGNPSLLTMLCILRWAGVPLPERRTRLYAGFCRLLLDGLAEETLRLLHFVAYAMTRHNRADITLDEVEQISPLSPSGKQPEGREFVQIAQNSGVLVAQGKDTYRFAALILQEYLTAVHLLDQGRVDELIAHVGDSWWQETIRLYCGLTEATAVIAACLQDDPPPLSTLTLAIACLKEADAVEEEVLTRVEQALAMGIRSDDHERRMIGAEGLLRLRLQRMMPVSETLAVDSGFITHAEYRLFIEDRGIDSDLSPADQAEDSAFLRVIGHEPVMGSDPAEAMAFCAWLTAREGGVCHYRLPGPGELERYETINGHSWPEMRAIFAGANRQSVAYPLESVRHQTNRGDNLARDLARTSDLTSAITHDLVIDLARTYKSGFAENAPIEINHSVEQLNALASALRSSRMLADDLRRDMTIDEARELTERLIQKLETAANQITINAVLSGEFGPLLDNAINNAYFLAREPAMETINALVAQVIYVNLVAARVLLTAGEHRGAAELVQRVSDHTLQLAGYFVVELPEKQAKGRLSNLGEAEAVRLQRSAALCLDLHVDLVLLGAGRPASPAAPTGIRLVKERLPVG